MEKSEVAKRVSISETITAIGVPTLRACAKVKECCMTTGFPTWNKLCKGCWIEYNGINHKFFDKIQREVGNGRKSFARRKRGSVPGRRLSAQSNCFNWLQTYSRRGDLMPDCGEIHLPDYRWREVWKKYKNDVSGESRHYGDGVSEAVFTKIRKSDLPYIKIRKVKRFAKCQVCSKLIESIDKSTGATRDALKRELDEHVEWQFREREKYYKHRFKARSRPHMYLTMSVDGMDNGKTSIPRLARENKDTDGKVRLGTHLTGVLLHGRKFPVRAVTWYDRFPTGSDSIVSIILHALSETAKEGPLPPVLYLHLDNCCRENKNRCVRMFVLVSKKNVF